MDALKYILAAIFALIGINLFLWAHIKRRAAAAQMEQDAREKAEDGLSPKSTAAQQKGEANHGS